MGVPVKKAGKGKKASRPSRPQLSAEELYVEAQMAWIGDEHDVAKAKLKRALELEPENVKCLDMYGGLLADQGPRDEAVVVLKKAAELQPDQGFEKFMYLGQLLEGEEALAAIRKGVQVLRAKLQLLESGQLPEEDSDVDFDEEMDQGEMMDSLKDMTKAELCSALCALGEHMVAASEEGDGPSSLSAVEGEVEQILGEARQLCPASPEPLQALCSLRKLQEKGEEALQLLRQSMALWFKPPNDEGEEGEGGEGGEGAAARQSDAEDKKGAAGEEESDDDDDDLEMGEEEEDLPSFEFRFETAKLLLELEESTDTAVQVLEGLLWENDQAPHVWLLMALALRGAGEWEEALAAVEEGEELIKPHKLPADDEMVISFTELRTELQQLMEAGEGDGSEAVVA